MSGAIAISKIAVILALVLLSNHSAGALLPDIKKQISISVVLSRDDQPYEESVAALREAVARAGLKSVPAIHAFTISRGNADLAADVHRSKPDLVVTVGASAARQVKSWEIPAPTLCMLLPMQAFQAVWTTSGGTPKRARPVGAVILDQPALRQLNLVRMLNLKQPRVALLSGKLTRSAVAPFRHRANNLGITLHDVNLDNSEKPIDALKKAIAENDVILVLPDASSVTPQHAKWLLYMAYQRSRPVLGYSQAFVDAGAIAAVYSTPSQIGREAGEIIARVLSDPDTGADYFSKIRYPRYFTVGTNRSVARSLGIRLPDAITMTAELQRMESSDQ